MAVVCSPGAGRTESDRIQL